MKRILLTVVLLQSVLFAYSANADLVFYQIFEDGHIAIMTDDEGSGWGNRRGYYSLEYVFDPNDSLAGQYYLNVYKDGAPSSSVYFPPLGKLLLKTTQNTVIELTGTDEMEFTEYEECKPIYRQRQKYRYFDGHEYRKNRGRFEISREQINTIISEGIIKVRIESTADFYEWEYSGTPNKASEIFKKLLDQVDLHTSIYNNF